MGIHLLGLIGVLIALVGAAMMVIPRPLSFVLRLFGVRWNPHDASRVAAWGLVGIGLVVVVLTRAVR
ncbi:MAG TPA: hypothetical protein VN193_08150 [Candidatus Angelobacter sp.]|jgi:hypothetical protein|nr:hypothetical protein [Candidatus Angelobacter sp.]